MPRTLNCFVPLPFDQTTCVVRTRIEYGSEAYGVSSTARHLAYLSRPGTAQDGGQAPLFNATGFVSTEARNTFIAACAEDPWQFRWILSPMWAHELDLMTFCRAVMTQVETDLGVRLPWVAAAHYNTDEPHVHVVVRPRGDGASPYRISGDYLVNGLRARATMLADLLRQ